MYVKLVAVNDHWARNGMENQVTDSGSRYFGGVADPENGIPWPSHGGTPMVMALWAAALINKDSVYYHDQQLLSRLALGAKFMLRFQHGDGTISPGWTNMHSPPDTAFVVVGLAQVYQLLTAHDWEPLRDAAADIRLFLERAIPALLTGGCHTPNHRWVLVAALGFMFRLTGRPELRERAREWLAEGMDNTEDGEWTERSNGIYNGVSDIMLVHAADLFDLPELLEPVRRNLRMMAYLVHPDGEVVTDYSGRQDFGHRYDMSSYFLVCRRLAHRDRDPLFAALAKLAGEALDHPGWLPNNALLGFLLHPELREEAVEPGELPDRYRVVINGNFPRERYLSGMEAAGHGGRIYHSKLHPEFGAPVARQRDGSTSVTVMTETNSFFALRHGAARLLAVQIGTSFEPGYVKMERLTPTERGYRLSASEAKGYYGPVPAVSLPETASGPVSPWYLLPHHLRVVTHLQHHRVEVELTESEEGWKLRVHCAVPDPILTQIQFVFGKEGAFDGDGLAPAEPEAWFWKEGTVRYTSGGDWLELDGGAHAHWAKAIQGTSFPGGCRTLVVNLTTPYDRTFDIRLSPRDANAAEAGSHSSEETGR
ncbi:hypothetical protein GE107_17125 [Cohnella sp. CFH 77786]|uniref:hypothetical protein n=1 Tax=Cohnella sp. CFH 77786 TaxID=2662265 RepID=UPI001C61010C|nr:hypothetical protein [Cohnella sp. CFH 77786]MBW5447780.1 hypothetical protein [Cohnella sp. CFH 77786]